MNRSEVFSIQHLETSREEWLWPFSEQRHDEIAAHFAMLREKTPALWNGRVLLMNRCTITGGAIRGSFFETGFADFIAWKHWGHPDRSIVNAFAMGAILTSDNAYLVGVMGSDSVNAGQIYFPSGTPDPSDVVGQTVNLASSVMREVEEETGLAGDDFESPTVWTAVRTGPSLALMRILRSRSNAEALRARIVDNLAHQKHPEFSDIRIVRTRTDFHPDMPGFMTAFLDHALAG
jgi:8-oxo-dGTP pyrophosphatase MutT (NUDIX family)